MVVFFVIVASGESTVTHWLVPLWIFTVVAEASGPPRGSYFTVTFWPRTGEAGTTATRPGIGVGVGVGVAVGVGLGVGVAPDVVVRCQSAPPLLSQVEPPLLNTTSTTVASDGTVYVYVHVLVPVFVIVGSGVVTACQPFLPM